MKGRRTMRLVLTLALLSVGGLIGMLVATNDWDLAYFLLSALPIVVGGWCAWLMRGKTR